MPARAVVFNSIRKHDGNQFRVLEPGTNTISTHEPAVDLTTIASSQSLLIVLNFGLYFQRRVHSDGWACRKTWIR